METRKTAAIYIKPTNTEETTTQVEKCKEYIQKNNYIEYKQIYEDSDSSLFTEYDKLVSSVKDNNIDVIIISSLNILNKRRKWNILHNNVPIEPSDYDLNPESHKGFYLALMKAEEDFINKRNCQDNVLIKPSDSEPIPDSPREMFQTFMKAEEDFINKRNCQDNVV